MPEELADEITLEEYQQQVEAEALEEYQQNDPVHRDVRYVYFTSKSKGIRNGKRRLRRNWKEVELISYRDGPFISWHKFPFDVYATECLGASVRPDNADAEFRERIRNLFHSYYPR